MATMRETNGTEYFYAIPGLGVPKHEVSPTLEKDIEYMMDWIPHNADALQYLQANHNEAFIGQMTMLKEMLDCMYARWMVNDAVKIIKVASINDEVLCRKLLMPFIAKAHTLAIDMQMAQKNAGVYNPSKQAGKTHDDAVERYQDIINSMRIINELLEKDSVLIDFDQMSDIVESIGAARSDTSNAAKSDATFNTLLTGIATKNIRVIKNETEKIIRLNQEKIHAMNRSATEANPKKKILIVDDMAEVLTTLTLMLEPHFQVIPLSDGFDALMLIDEGNIPDAMILDIDMPMMDGFTLAQEIRRREKCAATPLLFLTSNSTRETVIKAFHCNAANFIVKPANKDTIISRLISSMA